MIEISVWDDDGAGVWMLVEGHAENATKRENTQVCAGVSTLMMTIVTVTEGRFDGEGSGFMSCNVGGDQLRLAEFVLLGLQLIETHYPGQVTIVRRDTRLFNSPETRLWNRSTLPSPPPEGAFAL